MFRFTIRDVLWLTVVVAVGLALGLGWLADRRRLAAENDAIHLNYLRAKNEIMALAEAELRKLQVRAEAMDAAEKALRERSASNRP